MHTDHTVGVRVEISGESGYLEYEQSPFLTEKEAKDSAVEEAVGDFIEESGVWIEDVTDPYNYATVESYTPPE